MISSKDELPKDIRDSIRCAAEIIRGSKKGAVLSGAGISTSSGIPDFRSPENGLWGQIDPMEVASLLSFRYNPSHFFEWMRPLVERIYQAKPNPAHFGLARLECAGYIQTIITQNIDGLHQRAGSRNVLEVHGSLKTLTCINCYRQYPAEYYTKAYLDRGEIPSCPHCGNILKPDLILFGEQMPARTWLKAREVCKECDLMIIAGSSLEVLPAANLPMQALGNGARLIIINRTSTYLDVRADVVFHKDLAEIIPIMVKAVLQGR